MYASTLAPELLPPCTSLFITSFASFFNFREENTLHITFYKHFLSTARVQV